MRSKPDGNLDDMAGRGNSGGRYKIEKCFRYPLNSTIVTMTRNRLARLRSKIVARKHAMQGSATKRKITVLRHRLNLIIKGMG